jgi:Ca2+-binding RTX toxin-like protein
MSGGDGDDSYYIDNAGDVVVEANDGGIDTVYSRINHTLGANFENLILMGMGNTTAIGNGLTNLLIGNSGNNILNGHAGADTMLGGAGNDTYHVENEGDMVDETGGSGTDTVVSYLANYTLGTDIENLTLAASAGSANGTGNELANRIIGNSSANILDGGGGSDTMTGSGGSDHFVFKDSLGADNIDYITDFSSSNDRIALSSSIFASLNGTVTEENFFVGSTDEAGPEHRLIYDNSTGSLYYDADGTGESAAVRFAVLSNIAALTYSDFDILA